MADDIAIKVDGVSKAFRLPHEKQTSVKGLFLSIFSGRRTYERQQVLKDMSFEIKRGEFFGIVGRNGSGKSTLLKLLAGIYTPDKGRIQVNGKLTPFIELGVGFNPELTGRENVYLNGALLGFNRKEMEAMYDEIVEFAELEKFMDQKLKNYSSGMQVRLAFSVAIRAKSDILVLDEVLAVGDLDFQRKCYDYFYNLKRDKQTVVLVSHDMSAVRRFCDRCIHVHNGAILAEGSPKKVADSYMRLNLEAADQRLTSENGPDKVERDGIGGARIVSVKTFSPKTDKTKNTFTPDEPIGVRVTFEASENIDQPTLGFIFQNQKDETVFATNNWLQNVTTKSVAAGKQIVLDTVVDNVFTDDTYSIAAAIESKDLGTVYDRVQHMHSFAISGHELAHATTHPSHKMKVTYP
jgi:ABC-2 type transport system ATP-binding protein